MNLQETSVLIDASPVALNLPSDKCKKEGDGKWTYTINGATVYIDVFNFTSNPQNYYLQVCSPLLKVPDKNNEAFYLDMLELNYDTYSCSICKKGDWFYVMCLVPTKGLDQQQVNWMIDKVAYYSNDYYSKLSFKYKGSWPPEPPAGNNNNNNNSGAGGGKPPAA
jgi:hypothetical protein